MDRSTHIQPSALTVAAIKRVRLVLSARRGLRLKSSGVRTGPQSVHVHVFLPFIFHLNYKQREGKSTFTKML